MYCCRRNCNNFKFKKEKPFVVATDEDYMAFEMLNVPRKEDETVCIPPLDEELYPCLVCSYLDKATKIAKKKTKLYELLDSDEQFLDFYLTQCKEWYKLYCMYYTIDRCNEVGYLSDFGANEICARIERDIDEYIRTKGNKSQFKKASMGLARLFGNNGDGRTDD